MKKTLPRQLGKSTYVAAAMEAALNAGKRVAFADAVGVRVMRRKGRLTLIESKPHVIPHPK